MQDKGGGTVQPERVQREIRRCLNKSAGAIAEKLLAKALTGDSVALAACSSLLIEANRQPIVANQQTDK